VRSRDWHNAGRFIATTFNVDGIDVSVVVDEKRGRVITYFDFEPILYFVGTTRNIIKEAFDSCLYRYRLMYGEPSEQGIETFKREQCDALSMDTILNQVYNEKDIIKLNEAVTDDYIYSSNEEENLQK